MRRRSTGLLTVAAFGYAFLYVPIVSVMVYSTLLGTLVGLALVRLGRFRGRTLLGGMITAPLVMPEIITGISLLFLFISLGDWLGWPATRGATTIATTIEKTKLLRSTFEEEKWTFSRISRTVANW